MLQELADRVWSNARFRDELRALLRRNLQDYTRVSGEHEAVSDAALTRLIQSATQLAATADADKKEYAYRIASAAWTIFGTEYGAGLQSLLRIIFGRMGNFPAIRFLYRELVNDGPEARRMLPGEGIGNPIWLEIESRRIDNEVDVPGNRILTLTDFQRRLWQALRGGRSVTLTAPTSAGKSFALQYFLGSQLAERKNFFGLYIVPTRSLIHQVSTSLRTIGREITDNEITVLTVPQTPLEAGISSGIYVLTQERLQVLLDIAPGMRFDLVVVDEAQTVSADSRGIILQTVIDSLRRSNPETQFLFSTPTAANPGVFDGLFGFTGTDQIDETESPVAQNLVFLDTDTTVLDLVRVSAKVLERAETIGSTQIGRELVGSQRILATLSWHFGRNDQNLVYVGSQAAAEDVAGMISQLQAEVEVELPAEVESELQELSVFLREHVHPQYLLADTVLNGVAFHYGQMPSVVRQAIEDYFDEGLLRFLVSTSTLLHGVNLPAKNLFLLDPTKGGEWPQGQGTEAISGAEFWNLAGRAGRLGKEFEGNVFIINRGTWRSDSVEQDRRQAIRSALDEHVREKKVDLLNFIADKNHASGKKDQQGLESAFVRLFNDHRRGDLDKTLSRIYPDDATSVKEVRKIIESSAKHITLPLEITERHITVSVFRQQRMYDYLLEKFTPSKVREYVPPHPLTDWSVAYQGMIRLIRRVHSQFEDKTDNSYTHFARLALLWMRGEPLPKLISNAVKIKVSKSESKPTKSRRKAADPNVATIIRSVMANIETDLQFRYVKYIGCYIDILRLALNNTNNGKLSESIPNIPLYLELGAASTTMVSFISLGLSRTTAGVLTGKAVNQGMTQPQAERWLLKQNLEGMGISGICIREVDKLWRRKK